ncbi:MAG TPA: cytochrome c biogenesis protein ResB, partial [Deltaproteobacteria bacterium]|nr:cytochrome c biogenesis protein ResB [Deltaproteobacteria bacterium]
MKKRERLVGRLAAFWSSLKCTVILLLGLALLCVAGTLIPQHVIAPVAGQGPGAWFLARLKPTDLYHSLWLVVLAGLLCLNLVLCMRLRLRARGRILAPRFKDAEGISLDAQRQAVKARILEAAPRAMRFQERQDGAATLLFGQTEGLRRPATLGLHASVVLIFVGMHLSAFGIDGKIELSEGQTAAQFIGADGRPRALGFSVRCDQFLVSHYPNGMPKEYVSRLTFLEDGNPR